MEVKYFFDRRVTFIRQLYETATAPFIDRKSRIESGTAPFDPYYSEDGEPPYIEAWIEADESLHILAYTCVSMLAASLHLYFRTWEGLCGVPAAQDFKVEFKDGWLNGYRAYFQVVAQINIQDSPANLWIIEEVVLVRNRVQHPESITGLLAAYSYSDLKKLPSAFFLDPSKELTSELTEGERDWLIPPTFHISKEKLERAVSEVEKLVKWLEPKLERRRAYGRE